MDGLPAARVDDYAQWLMEQRDKPGPWGEAIRYWLQIKAEMGEKWTQRQLAEAAGIQRNTVSHAVRGFDVGTKALRAIARALRQPIDYILVPPAMHRANDERYRQAIIELDRQKRLEEDWRRQQAVEQDVRAESPHLTNREFAPLERATARAEAHRAHASRSAAKKAPPPAAPPSAPPAKPTVKRSRKPRR
jgi:transcriptional regulator with XRE-family HTH domain